MEDKSTKPEQTPEVKKPVTLEDIDSRIAKLDEKTALLKAENDRTEKMLMNQRLAGMSGMPQTEQPKVETAKEYAERVMGNKVVKKDV
jgi:hypothetical protein